MKIQKDPDPHGSAGWNLDPDLRQNDLESSNNVPGDGGGGGLWASSFLWQPDTSTTPLPMRYASMGYISMGFTSMGYTSARHLNF